MATASDTTSEHHGGPSVRCVVVPLDGSAFAAGALQTASALAERFGVPLEAVTVAAHGARVEVDADALALVEASGAHRRVVAGDHPAEGILAHAEEQAPCIVCMSTHGRGRVVGSLVGSVAQELLRLSPAPIVAVGPNARPPAAGSDRPAPFSVPRLVACVDGTDASEAVIPTAAAWATALGMALTILTVAEPAPLSTLPSATPTVRVGHLTAADAEIYVADLAQRWSARAPGVAGVVVLDPISPAAGVEAHLRDNPTGLVAVSTHARRGLHRLWSGATASSIVNAATVPVLVVPIEA